jgi:hypothetical protein
MRDSLQEKEEDMTKRGRRKRGKKELSLLPRNFKCSWEVDR